MTRRQYRNPPIEEAICELRFVADSEPDFAAPLRFYESIKASYPAKPQAQPLPPSELEVHGQGSGFQVAMRNLPTRLLFKNDDETRLVGFTLNMLSVHVLRPYPGWEEFRRRIEEALNAYRRTIPAKAVSRIGLRYVNKIEIPEANVSLKNYVTISPQIPNQVVGDIQTFVTRLETGDKNKPWRIALTIASVEPSSSDSTALLMDIDVRQEWESSKPLALDDVLNEIDLLRAVEREAFESFICDPARRLFDA